MAFDAIGSSFAVNEASCVLSIRFRINARRPCFYGRSLAGEANT